MNFSYLFTNNTLGNYVALGKNLVRKRTPQICSSALNLAFIGKTGSLQESLNVKICPKLWFLAIGSGYNEHIQMKFGV